MKRANLPEFPFSLAAFSAAVDGGLLPEVAALAGIVERNPWHDRQPALTHTRDVVGWTCRLVAGEGWGDAAAGRRARAYCAATMGTRTLGELTVAASVLHDIGKVSTFTDTPAMTVCPEHELVSASATVGILSRFSGFSDEDREYVRQLVLLHGVVHLAANRADADPADARQWGRRFAAGVGSLAIPLIIHGLADTLGGSLATVDPPFLAKRRELLEGWAAALLP
jgi:hypothetical protein